jgi:ubiquinone/menaquinone biosynthesis C-methylase UbiE
VLDYDREAERYDATRGGDARADTAADAIETLLALATGGFPATPASFADVGCGTGIVTVRLLRPGRSVTGIERSAGMAAVAAARLPGRIMLGDAARLPLAAGSADVVTMVWLLHLLNRTDSASAVAEGARVLSPGGLLITTVGKNDAAYGAADDAAAILRPVRARFDPGQTDSRARVLEIGRRHGLDLAAQATFTGIGQGLSPRRWRKQLRRDPEGWRAGAGPERLDALCAALAALPDQDLPRADPVYQLVALRKRRSSGRAELADASRRS